MAYLVEPEVRVVGDVTLPLFISESDVGKGCVVHPFVRSSIAGIEPDLQPDGREEPGQGEDEHGHGEEE